MTTALGRFTIGVAVAASLLAAPFPAATAAYAADVQWWHAMQGELNRAVERLAAEFNATQRDYRIVPVYKGSYTETLTAAIFAQRAKQGPAIVQVNEIATATLMAAKGAIYPVHQLMKDGHEPFDPAAYLPAVTGYYADIDGNMLSFPFNASTPILYYNKDQFRAAGLDPAAPPKTWPDVEAAGRRLRAAGVPCGFTTHWPSWVNIENLSAFHNQPIATRTNGFGGLDTELMIDNALVMRHLTALANWQRDKIFDYGGRTNLADPKFIAGQCGIFVGTSAARPDILAGAKFDLGYGLLPYWPDVAGAPQNSIIGGATLWVLRGRPAQEYRGAAAFFAFLSRPEVQARWHQSTGYLPITRAAYELTRQQGYYERNPGADISIRQMTLKPPTENSRGLRLGSFVLIRDVIEDEMEQAIFGRKTTAEAIAAAQRRGNELLRRFERANR